MIDLIKKVLLVSIIGLVSFPILYLSFMFGSGQLRIEKGTAAKVEEKEVEYLDYSPLQDSLSAVYSKTYQSMVEQQKRIQQEKRRLKTREERMLLMDAELEKKAKEIDTRKQQLERIVKSSESLEDKRIKALARIYGSMRPDEAAPILETLPDKLIISILKGIGEDRQKAKILEKMNRERAGRISKQMGSAVLKRKKS